MHNARVHREKAALEEIEMELNSSSVEAERHEQHSTDAIRERVRRREVRGGVWGGGRAGENASGGLVRTPESGTRLGLCVKCRRRRATSAPVDELASGAAAKVWPRLLLRRECRRTASSTSTPRTRRKMWRPTTVTPLVAVCPWKESTTMPPSPCRRPRKTGALLGALLATVPQCGRFGGPASGGAPPPPPPPPLLQKSLRCRSEQTSAAATSLFRSTNRPRAVRSTGPSAARCSCHPTSDYSLACFSSSPRRVLPSWPPLLSPTFNTMVVTWRNNLLYNFSF